MFYGVVVYEHLHYTGQYFARKQTYKEFCQSSNRGRFSTVKIVRAVRDREIEKRNTLRTQRRAIKQKKDQQSL